MLKKSLVILLLASPFLRAEQECEDALKGKNKCGKFRSLTVCNNTTTGSLTVTGNETVGGTLNVAGSASFGGPLLIGGVAALTALRSYGQAYANAAQLTSGLIQFVTPGSAINVGVTVNPITPSQVLLANIGTYYVRYSVLFSSAIDAASGTGSIILALNGTPLTTPAAGYIQSISLPGAATTQAEELSGGVFITTTTANSFITVGATFSNADVTLATAIAPGANATLEIIQVN
jgi:hypothetical protein